MTPNPNPFEGLNVQMVERITRLEKRLNDLSAERPLFDVQNEDTPAQFVANQDNYDPGKYDVLRVSSDTSRTITGIQGGRKGRRILWVNVGDQDIVFAHESGSSTAANRITVYNASSYTLATDEMISTYYDSTTSRWRIGQMSF